MWDRLPRLLFEDREILVMHQPAASDMTLITFSDLTFRPSRRDFWGRDVARALGIDAVGFVVRRQNWFPTESVEAAAPAVRAVLKPRSLAYGYSMGGYGALKHGARLGAQGSLALGPQVSIAPADTPWDPRFHRFHRPALHRGMPVTAADLTPFAAILADPYDAIDWGHATRLAALGPVEIIRTPFVGHAVIWLLAGQEPLAAALDRAFAADAAGLRAVLRQHRGTSGHWFRLMGRAAYRRGRDRLAEALWTRGQAIGMRGATIGAERADALGDRIEVMIARGAREDAVAACHRLEGLAPKAPGLVGRAAHLLLAAGAPAEAEAAFHRALALRPDAADLMLGLSLALANQGRAAEALAVARRGHAAEPGDGELATHLGHLLNAGGPACRGEAEAVFRAVLARQPGAGRALLGLSSVLAAQGERQKALVFAQRAVARLPGDRHALAWLARMLLDVGNTDRAERLFERVLRAAPGLPDGYLGLADALRARGRLAEAVAMVDRGLAALPGDPSLTERRAVLEAQRAPRRRASWPRRVLRRLLKPVRRQ
jgi:tetratricopeptide (TPR) repeat protein